MVNKQIKVFIKIIKIDELKKSASQFIQEITFSYFFCPFDLISNKKTANNKRFKDREKNLMKIAAITF